MGEGGSGVLNLESDIICSICLESLVDKFNAAQSLTSSAYQYNIVSSELIE